jgi:integrase
VLASLSIPDCRDFLAFLSGQGPGSTSLVSIEIVFEYIMHISKTQYSDARKKRYIAATIKLLDFLAGRGDIPHCYSKVFLRGDASRLLFSLKIDETGTAFQPSKQLEPFLSEILSIYDGHLYNAATKKKFIIEITNYFLFIEINHIEHSTDSVKSWLDNLPKNTLYGRRRQNITLFTDYLIIGSASMKSCYTWQPLKIDCLPDWSRNIILGFVAERQREGLSQSTLKTCRMAACRFFIFLDSKGIQKPQEISPGLVKEFHNTDKHSTPGSKNAYGIKIRQLPSCMAELKLIPQNLYLSISTKCAPTRSIINIMSCEMELAVYDYRDNAKTPFELRNAAIVMLGLRMGMRASDIANLKISDFDWKEMTLSFIQKKTSRAITLPVPVDAGNSVYKYIMEGRPESGIGGGGYVFIMHHAPFGGMKTIEPCRYALKKILSAYKIELPPGQGFHITRKTFATNLLKSQNTIDDISNALGHAAPETVEPYLLRDEGQMRLCPLPFESVGAV